MLDCKDSHQGHHYKFNVGNRHAGTRHLFLHILHHEDELGDAICLHVILHHICAQGDYVDGMKPSAVGIKGGHDVNGCDLRVKGVGIFQVIASNFIDDVTEKFGHALLGRLVTGLVAKSGFMGSLHMNASNQRGIFGNRLVVEWEMGRAYKFDTVVGFVLGGLGENGCEEVHPIQLVVGVDHEKGEKGLPDGN
jgi:hypothetical protein